MKVVLAQAHKSWKFATNGLVVPNGLLAVAASLEQAGHAVEVIDPLVRDLSLAELSARIKAAQPDLVGLYMTTDGRFRAFELIAAVKQQLGVPIMAGGPHPTFCADDTLRHVAGLDYIVRGEGEHSAVAIADALQKGSKDLSVIPNLSYRAGREIIHNQAGHFVEDINSLPLPAYHLINVNDYRFLLPVPGQGLKKAVAVFSGRGCPQGCIFCASTHQWQKRTRLLTVERMFEQMELLRDRYGIEYISFFDDTFNISRDRLERFCNEMIRRKPGLFWDAQIRAVNVDEGLLRLMRDAGCADICFGVESGSEYIRNTVISKKIANEDIYRIDEIARRIGLSCGINFMLSFPGETRGHAEETLRMIHRLRSKIYFNITKIYPGTPLEEIARERHVLKPGFRWSDPKGHKTHGTLHIPGLFGDIPFYKEWLGFTYIFEKSFEVTRSERWGLDKKRFALTELLKRFVLSIDHPRDVLMLVYIALGYVRWLGKRLVRWSAGDTAGQAGV